MKGLIVSSLSILLISAATAPAVRADKAVLNPTITNSTGSNIPQITPFNLVNLAYQGYFKDQGIPSYNGLNRAYTDQKVSAIDLVRSGVRAKRLPEETLSNQDYIRGVAEQLNVTFKTNRF